jgi:hypothetical protein
MFDMDPLLDLVGPFAAGEAGMELIRKRNVMCVPPKYVPILLGQALTPWEAYLCISGAIRTNGLEANCGSLLVYLWAACTRQLGQLLPTVQCLAPTIFCMDDVLYNHVWETLIYWDLPCLHQPETLEPGLHVAHAIGELVTEHPDERMQLPVAWRMLQSHPKANGRQSPIAHPPYTGRPTPYPTSFLD